jgi:hypothetical protein
MQWLLFSFVMPDVKARPVVSVPIVVLKVDPTRKNRMGVKRHW